MGDGRKDRGSLLPVSPSPRLPAPNSHLPSPIFNHSESARLAVTIPTNGFETFSLSI